MTVAELLEQIGNRLLPLPYQLVSVQSPYDPKDIEPNALYFEVRVNSNGMMLFSEFTLRPSDDEITFSRRLRLAYLNCKSRMIQRERTL